MLNDTKTKELHEAIGGVISALARAAMKTIVFVVVYGWAVVKFWTWFVIPIFELPPLNIPKAAGLVLLVSLVAKHHEFNESENSNKITIDLVYGFTLPLFVVLIGWIIQLFL